METKLGQGRDDLSPPPGLKKEEMNFEAKQNLLGFFSLLLKIDRRINPQNYENSGE